MNALFSLSYWFSIRPISFLPGVERGLLIFFSVFTVIGIVAYLFPLKKGFSKMSKRGISMIASTMTWGGVVGLLLWSFSYQSIPVFSMRFLYVLWLGWMVWSGYQIFRYFRVDVPQKQQMYQERLEREKWLPKKKK